MTLQRAKKNFLNFVKGLNTEASPLQFPEGTAKDLDNVDLIRDGSIKRRRGLDYETNAVRSAVSFSEADIQTKGISVHEWRSVNGNGSLNFLVVQIGGKLFFHDLGNQTLSQGIIGSIDFSDLKVDPDFDLEVVDTAYGRGRLFVVGRYISPFYVEYDEDANTFSGHKLTLKIRDIQGLPDDRVSSSPTLTSADISNDESKYESLKDDDISGDPSTIDFNYTSHSSAGSLF